MRYPDYDHKYRNLPYAQQDLGSSIGAGIGVMVVGLALLIGVIFKALLLLTRVVLHRFLR